MTQEQGTPLEPPRWDPVPVLAQIIDGLHEVAKRGGDRSYLAALLVGPCARLRGGLLLDFPEGAGKTTEQALREVLR